LCCSGGGGGSNLLPPHDQAHACGADEIVPAPVGRGDEGLWGGGGVGWR
jgi:hypothetical protein